MTAAATRSQSRPWFYAALATALVMELLCQAVVVLMIVNYAQQKLADPLDSEEMLALKETLRKDPKNEEVKSEIRRLDLVLREEYFRRQAFAERGAYLLVGALAAFLIALRYVAHCQKELPMPKRVREGPQEEARAAARARWAVSGLGLAMAVAAAAGGLYWMSGCSIEPLDEEGPAAAASPADRPPPSPDEVRRNWPRFRGPDGTGVAVWTNAPAVWNGETGENIRWKAAVPLEGENSPVVWGDRVFLTGATVAKREVYCFDAVTGAILWTRPVQTPQSDKPKPPDPIEEAGFAAPTAATDGRFVCAIFANGDLACFDVTGKPVWTKNLGVPNNAYGHGASLLIHGDLLLVPYDQGAEDENMSRLLAFDLKTGAAKWSAERPVAASWATPIVIQAPQGEQLITAADPWAIAYDPATGRQRWRAKVLKGDVASSPVYAAGLVYTTTVQSDLCAIRPDGTGDVTATGVAWKAEGEMPDITSPLSDGTHVWVLTTDGLLTCFDAKDGTKAYEQEFDGLLFKGSPTLVGDRIYTMTAKGVMLIFAPGGAYRELGRAELGEPSSCSPAFVDGRIYIRTTEHLYCIGARP